MSNSVALSGALLERKSKRFTPAGLPVIEGLISHCSEVQEASSPRTIEMDVRFKALGSIAERIEAIRLGTPLKMQGFLAPARLRSQQLIFHITNFELE
jgi:primosomal replication protein N